MLLRISSRQSDLARLQAYQVGERLKERFPEIKIQYQFRESLGDKNLTDPLWKMPEKGVFTQDFVQDLIDEKTDLIVHSWKDLPIESHPLTFIAATLKRADPRDILLFKKSSLEKLSQGEIIKIYSSSPRREYNLTEFLPKFLPYGKSELQFLPVRGNIQTRVKKLLEQPDVDGLVLAKAALDRLLEVQGQEFEVTKNFLRQSLSQLQWMVLPLSFNPTAAAQGALAIEVKTSRNEVLEILKQINDPMSFQSAQNERQILSSYGGGCHQKIGVTEFQGFQFIKGLPEKSDSAQLEAVHIRRSVNQNPNPLLATANIVNTDLIFERQYLDSAEISTQIAKSEAIMVAHPSMTRFFRSSISSSQIVWTSGFETWKALASLGIWVHGSTEGISESFGFNLETLTDNHSAGPIKWSKLSHQSAPLELPFFELIAAYRLTEKSVNWSELEKTFISSQAFFWKSSSVFRKVRSHWSWLEDRQHFCGPGHTYAEIQKMCPNLKLEPVWPTPTHLHKP